MNVHLTLRGGFCTLCKRYLVSKSQGCLSCDAKFTDKELEEIFGITNLTYIGTLDYSTLVKSQKYRNVLDSCQITSTESWQMGQWIESQ